MLARKWLVLSVQHTGLRVLEKEGRGENLQILCSHRLNPNPIYTTGHVLHVWGEHVLLLCVARARQPRSQILKQHRNSFLRSCKQRGARQSLVREGSSAAPLSSPAAAEEGSPCIAGTVCTPLLSHWQRAWGSVALLAPRRVDLYASCR